MKIFSSFNELFEKIKNAFSNFPITLIWAILGTFFTIWFVDQQIGNDIEFNYIKVIFTAILGVSWLIATRLSINYFKEEKHQNKNWLILIPLVFLAIYYFSLPNSKTSFDDEVIPYRFTLFLITGHLVIFFSPFIFTWSKKAYWNYLKNIFVSFARSVIFSIVIYLGITLALMALKYLFKIKFDTKIYFELFIFCAGIINTAIFLSDIPKQIHQNKTINYPKALLVFVKYILIPLTILYLIILYAYSFKILINWNLPKGWVSYLVVALSVLGFIIHILINPIRKNNESRVIRNFYPWFYYALLPLILLLFAAIFKRITDYGFTENRYLVLVLAFWILGMTLYILFSRRKQLRYFPMTVAIISMLVSFGFWGMFSVSINSQAKRFERLFNQMKSSNFEVKNKDYASFESTTRYLSKRKSLYKTSAILGFNPEEIYKNKHPYEVSKKLKDTLNIKITDFNPIYQDAYKMYGATQTAVVNIKGYDYFTRVMLNSNIQRKFSNNNTKNTTIYKFILDKDTKKSFYIIKQKDTLQQVDLSKLVDKLSHLNLYSERQNMPQESLMIERKFDDLAIKLLIQNMQIYTDTKSDNQSSEIKYINGIIFIKNIE